ncbi:MAG: adenylate/guanylate cyclase domain-containing protein [Burkholderiales bacterium]|jgi:adenylate cyclase
MDSSTTPQVIASLLALGIALAFIVGDRQAPTSRALSLFLASIGISIACFSQFELPLVRDNRYPYWGGVFAIPDVCAFYFGYEWLLRIRKTIPTRNLKTRVGDIQLRVAQLLAIVYGALALVFPHVRAYEFSGGLSGSDLGPGFYLFAVPLAISLGLGIASGILTLNRRPDVAERQRLLSFLAATPFLASSMVLPTNLSPIMVSFGMLVFLVGGMQYYVIQGRRAQFMSRFLAPQVADLVREQGLASATREQTLELSVVCCDLRGFTAFAAAAEPGKVIQILREYYDAVGAAAGRAGGTIKDQAGDGVLILVGAPIAFDDHARRALTLARDIRATGAGLTARWSNGDLQLGVGFGVATGLVSVGVIGTASRLEYAAVGSAVNLASRLCAEAVDTEILVDQRTVDLAKGAEAGLHLIPSAPRKLKGFVQPVPSYLLGPGE